MITLSKFRNTPFFTINALKQVQDLSDNSIYQNIKRWMRKGKIVQLKKGLYVTQKYLEKCGNMDSYLEFVANNLRYPSYLSLEYVLQKYNILSESVFAFTSVSLKTKRSYRNKLGKFLYFQVKRDLFCGYKKKKDNGYEVKIATKSKSLFDYLYYRKSRIQDLEGLRLLRLNLESFNDIEMKKLGKFFSLEGSKKMKSIYKLLIQYKNDT